MLTRPKYESVFIQSKDRESSSSQSSSNFDYSMKNSISVAVNALQESAVTQCIIPYTFYAIDEGINNNILYNDGAGNKKAPITPGTYTHTELAVEVAIALNLASSNTWTCTYDHISDLFTLTASASSLLTWNDPAGHGSSAHEVLGFIPHTTAAGLLFVSTLSPVIEPSVLYVRVTFLEQSEEKLQTKINNYTFTIPITSAWRKNIVYKPDTPLLIQQFDSATVIKNLNIQVYSDLDELNPINLRGQDMSIELRFT